jgi:hypothetical protein
MKLITEKLNKNNNELKNRRTNYFGLFVTNVRTYIRNRKNVIVETSLIYNCKPVIINCIPEPRGAMNGGSPNHTMI